MKLLSLLPASYLAEFRVKMQLCSAIDTANNIVGAARGGAKGSNLKYNFVYNFWKAVREREDYLSRVSLPANHKSVYVKICLIDWLVLIIFLISMRYIFGLYITLVKEVQKIILNPNGQLYLFSWTMNLSK